jgi:outer membrane protein assembly factor BamB
MKINPTQRGRFPKIEPATPYISEDGRIQGWKIAIPGERPLATPAVADGRVFLGGGFGSYEFYAFDAATGSLAWQYQTTDDGPTAAVVEDGYVVFNTESCELEVLTVEGRPVWKKWLGDPLMSMPAMNRGRVYMAYPDRRHNQPHCLACFDIRTGKEDWKKPIAGEIITAPVAADGHLYLATVDGTLYCFHQDDGRLVWHEPKNATSSPAVWNQQCYFSQRHEVSRGAASRQGVQQTEHVAARGAGPGAATRPYRGTARAADWLDAAKRKMGSPRWAAHEEADAGVGFAAHKGSAKIHQAMKNLGIGTVFGVWSYQGSKPFLAKGRLYSALGDTLNCVDPDTEAVLWKKTLHEPKEPQELLDGVLTPAAVVNDKLFLGTVFGEVYCLSALSGEVLWSAAVGEPVVFQPAVAQGRVYVPTSAGSLYCLETGDPSDDGWLMWGATGAHNGLPD